MAYSKQTWSTGDPITQEKMNHIEDGIADAHSAASAATSDVSDLLPLSDQEPSSLYLWFSEDPGIHH